MGDTDQTLTRSRHGTQATKARHIEPTQGTTVLTNKLSRYDHQPSNDAAGSAGAQSSAHHRTHSWAPHSADPKRDDAPPCNARIRRVATIESTATHIGYAFARPCPSESGLNTGARVHV